MGRQRSKNRQAGFTLLEVMVVVLIMGILATQAVYSATKQQKRAKRTEVVLGLDKIREAQYAYKAEYGTYASSFRDLIFRTAHGQLLSDTVYQGKVYQYTLSQPWGENSYYVTAVGNLDGDAFVDMFVLEAGRI